MKRLLAVVVVTLFATVAAFGQSGTGTFKFQFDDAKKTATAPAHQTAKPAIARPVAQKPPVDTFTLRVGDLRQLLSDARAAQPTAPVIVQAPAPTPTTNPDAVKVAEIQKDGLIEAARLTADAAKYVADRQAEAKSAELTDKKEQFREKLANDVIVAKINRNRGGRIFEALIGAGGRIGQGALTRPDRISLTSSPSLTASPTLSQLATLTGGNSTSNATGGSVGNVSATGGSSSASATGGQGGNVTNTNSNTNNNVNGSTPWTAIPDQPGCYITPFGKICI